MISSGKPADGTHLTKPELSGIAPFFIVENVPAALSCYRDRLGFDITFQGPSHDDTFFGIVRRGAAMIMTRASRPEEPFRTAVAGRFRSRLREIRGR